MSESEPKPKPEPKPTEMQPWTLPDGTVLPPTQTGYDQAMSLNERWLPGTEETEYVNWCAALSTAIHEKMRELFDKHWGRDTPMPSTGLNTQPDHTVTAEYLKANKWVAEPCELQLPVPDTWWKRKVQGGYVAVWKSQQFEDTWQFVVSCGANSERSMSGCNASMVGAMEESVERAKVEPRT